MWLLLQIVIPVCALIAIGFACRTFGIVQQNADEIIGDFVFKVAIPVLLFRLIATSNLEGINPWSIWGTYFSAVLLVWIVVAILIPFLFNREKLYGVIASVSSGFANTVLIGIPVTLQAYGEAGMVSLAVLLSVHLPVLLFFTIVHHDIAQMLDGSGGIVGQTTSDKVIRFFKTIFQNPIMIGIIAGGIVQLSGFTLPKMVLDITSLLSSVAGPMALVVLGIGLQKYGVKGNVGPALVTSGTKLFVLPGLVLVFGLYLFGMPPILVAGLVIAAAAPSGVNSYLFAQHFGTGQALAANSISISTPLSIITMTGWLAVLKVYTHGFTF